MGNSMNDLEMICHFENSAATIDSKCRALKEQAGYILNSEHLASLLRHNLFAPVCLPSGNLYPNNRDHFQDYRSVNWNHHL